MPRLFLCLVPSRLETIFEESESKCSSQTSLPATKQHRKEASSFQNQSALDALEGEAETDINRDISKEPDIKGTLSIANKSALEQESKIDATKTRDLEKESEIKGGARFFSNKTALERESSEEALERGTTITTSFKKPVPLVKINGNGKTKTRNQPSGGSPFLQHIPRGSSVSPADVKGINPSIFIASKFQIPPFLLIL